MKFNQSLLIKKPHYTIGVYGWLTSWLTGAPVTWGRRGSAVAAGAVCTAAVSVATAHGRAAAGRRRLQPRHHQSRLRRLALRRGDDLRPQLGRPEARPHLRRQRRQPRGARLVEGAALRPADGSGVALEPVGELRR